MGAYGEFTDSNRLAATASYFTLSRNGDIALRSFAYTEKDWEFFAGRLSEESRFHADRVKWAYDRWRREALALSFAAAVIFPMLAGLILRWQRDVIVLALRIWRTKTELAAREVTMSRQS